MSHFNLCVVLPDANLLNYEEYLDAVMEPYCESLEVDGYWDSQGTLTEVAARGRTWYEKSESESDPRGWVPKGWRQMTDKQIAKRILDHSEETPIKFVQNGDEIYVEQMTRYNPQSKWDWFEVGGRWRGHWKVKEEVLTALTGDTLLEYIAQSGTVSKPLRDTAQVDVPIERGQALLGQPDVFDRLKLEKGEPLDEDYTKTADVAFLSSIDLDGMRAKATAEAEARYERVMKVLDGLPPPKTFKEIREQWALRDEQIREYHNQPAIMALKEAGMFPFMEDPVTSLCLRADKPKETYLKRVTANVGTSYAQLFPDKGWIAPGEMGWFGTSTDSDEEYQNYIRGFWKRIRTYGEPLLVNVDCHI